MATRARFCGARATTISPRAMSLKGRSSRMGAEVERSAADFKVGLLGHGTVGSAFSALLEERAGEIARFNGRRPVICGVLTRSRGGFEDILSKADLLVELIGGIEP